MIAEIDRILVARFQATSAAASTSATAKEEARAAEASRYPLEAGGKRVRPLLLLNMANAVAGPDGLKMATQAACAIELVHTYSLVHDDLPSMDNDDFRRGRETTHKVFGEAQGLLVGDSLLTDAFAMISETPDPSIVPALVQILSRRAGPQGMILGQWLDLAFTAKQAGGWETLSRIHELKTGALLSAALEMGAICGIAAEPRLRKMTQEQIASKVDQASRIGFSIGLAFQIIDDVLDVTKSSQQLGKTAGKDQAAAKLTAVSLLGLDEAQRRADQLTNQALSGLKLWFADIERRDDALEKQVTSLLKRES